MPTSIPSQHVPAVDRALTQVFASTHLEAITPITRGLSSDLVYRIVVQGRTALLKIVTRPSEINDPARVFASMNTAADAGIAPRVLFADPATGVSLIDFIEAVPFPQDLARVELPRLLRRLHNLPPFPKAFNYSTAHRFFIARFRHAGLVDATEIQEAFTQYEAICAAYPRLDSDIVPCHSDLKPENILFDGHRPWLVDWMAAFMNDRYFDLAIAAGFLAHDDANERAFLEAYFEAEPDAYRRARFFLMSQILHMLSGAVFLILGSAGRPLEPQTPPALGDFQNQVWEGQIDMARNDMKIQCGLAHWNRLLANLRAPRFAESLRLVAERSDAANSPRLLISCLDITR